MVTEGIVAFTLEAAFILVLAFPPTLELTATSTTLTATVVVTITGLLLTCFIITPTVARYITMGICLVPITTFLGGGLAIRAIVVPRNVIEAVGTAKKCAKHIAITDSHKAITVVIAARLMLAQARTSQTIDNYINGLTLPCRVFEPESPTTATTQYILGKNQIT